MFRKSLHRVISLTLAFLITFTSVGFSIDVHYCKDKLKSVSLFGEAESCHAVKKTCPNHPSKVQEKEDDKNCCKNESIEIEKLDSEFNLSQDFTLTDLQVEVLKCVAFESLVFSNTFTKDAPRFNQKTPFSYVPVDIYVLLERYLI